MSEAATNWLDTKRLIRIVLAEVTRADFFFFKKVINNYQRKKSPVSVDDHLFVFTPETDEEQKCLSLANEYNTCQVLIKKRIRRRN